MELHTKRVELGDIASVLETMTFSIKNTRRVKKQCYFFFKFQNT